MCTYTSTNTYYYYYYYHILSCARFYIYLTLLSYYNLGSYIVCGLFYKEGNLGEM